MDLDLVAETLSGEPAYRTRQVWEWTARGAGAYAEMTNLSTGTRALLEEHVPFSTLEVAHEATATDVRSRRSSTRTTAIRSKRC